MTRDSGAAAVFEQPDVRGAAPAGEMKPAAAQVRPQSLLPVLLVGFVGLVAVLTVTPWPVGAYQDDAMYTVLAKALATGEGYRMINLPGSPHATHFPPAYPFFLSLLWRMSPAFPDNIVLFKFANALWLGVAALGAFAFARTRLRWGQAGAALAATAGTLSIVVLLVTGVVMSEPMFMALLFPALMLSDRAAREGSLAIAAAAGFAGAALALVRTMGAVIIPATLLMMIWRRNFRGAFVMLAAAAVLLVPWQLWLNSWQHEIPAVLMGKYGAYGPWLATGFQEGGAAFARDVVIANAKSVHRFLGYFFAPVSLAWPRSLAFAGVSGLTVIGLAGLGKRSPVTVLFLLAYAAILLLWPFEPDRFVIAVWPLFTLSFVLGVQAIWRWQPSRGAWRGLRAGGFVVIVAVVTGFLSFNVRGYRHQFWASIQRDSGRRAKPVVEWIATQTAPSDVVMTDDDVLIYLYTGRQSTPTSTFLPRERLRPLTHEDNIAAVRAMIDSYAPRYYITGSEPARLAAEALTTGPQPLLRRYRLIPSGFIYQRIGS